MSPGKHEVTPKEALRRKPLWVQHLKAPELRVPRDGCRQAFSLFEEADACQLPLLIASISNRPSSVV